MATTPEEFFMNCLMEQSPTSPSVCPDLPPLPDGCGEVQLSPNDTMLPYILRTLMEDDNDDELLDHPALLQVQQPFAEILSAPSIGLNIANNINIRGSKEGPEDSVQDGSCDQRMIEPAFTKDADAVGAFLKGMEEAKMLLPKYDSFREDDLVNRLFREGTNHTGPRITYSKDNQLKALSMTNRTMMIIEPESVDAEEIINEMVLQGCDQCAINMEKLRITMANGVKKNSRKGGRNTARVVVDLPTLLIYCAQAVAANNHRSVWQLLKEIRQHASRTGNATQRLAYYFADGLEARLSGSGSQLWQSQMVERTSSKKYLEAYYLYLAACCFDKVAINFSINIAMDTVAGKSKLHIVDYGLDYGFQWVGLLQSLVKREGGSPEVKITAISHPEHFSYPAEKIEETGRSLYNCAHKLGLPSFKFRAIRKKWEDVCIEDLDAESNEVLIVNDQFNLSTLLDESVFFDNPNPRDTVLNHIGKMKPDVFIQSVISCTYGTSFSTRFRGVLFYYMALFDMLDATIPRESKQRLVLEQRLFGRYAQNVVASEGADVVQHPEKYTQWQARNQRAGLRQIPLKPNIVKELVNGVKKCHKDFLLSEDGQWLLQGWMGRILFAHSTWVADESLSD